MAFNELFRRKSISSTLKDIEVIGPESQGLDLNRTLTTRDLTAFGIAAIIGGGIFTAVGNASFDGGPGIIFLYLFTALACGLAAYCYAEFASTIPISGSAYTYAYVAFGEIIAWIIGWDLLMEYAIGNIAVAISWSGYFCNLLEGFNIHLPAFLITDYPTVHAAFNSVSDKLAAGTSLDKIDPALVSGYNTWLGAPGEGAFKFIVNLPAIFIVIIITWVVFIGIKESRNASNFMVALKLVVIFVVIVMGSFYIHPDNWTPFTPNGLAGIMKGVSAVFFAYIGFDAISTTAEECKNPQRDLPRAMFYSLIICTVLYVFISLVLTGMVNYTRLGVNDPLAFVFKEAGVDWLAYVISISAVVATASVLLVFQLGQPRIWMSMSRDGLLPKVFGRIHPKYKTPSFSTILTGFLVAVPALFLNLQWALSLTSIGTLFAFVLVCGGVLILQDHPDKPKTGFKVPYLNGKWILPVLISIGLITTIIFNPNYYGDLIHARSIHDASGLFDQDNLNDAEIIKCAQFIKDQGQIDVPINSSADTLREFLINMNYFDFTKIRRYLPLPTEKIFITGISGFQMNIPKVLFILLLVFMAYWSFRKSFSIIPALGLLSCSYLLTGESWTNWARFIIWLIVGMVIYFSYSRHNSKLNKAGA